MIVLFNHLLDVNSLKDNDFHRVLFLKSTSQKDSVLSVFCFSQNVEAAGILSKIDRRLGQADFLKRAIASWRLQFPFLHVRQQAS